jgi:hypothetical protein
VAKSHEGCRAGDRLGLSEEWLDELGEFFSTQRGKTWQCPAKSKNRRERRNEEFSGH